MSFKNKDKSNAPTKPKDLSDFNQLDQALIAFLMEEYKSLHLHSSVATQTANRMLQFLVISIAAFGAVAINFLIKNELGDVVVSGLIWLLLPLTVEIIFLIWLREQLRILRNSVFLLGIERRISRYFYLAEPQFAVTSKPGRKAHYVILKNIFGDRFLNWELWVRDKGLSEIEIFIVVTVVFGIVSSCSGSFGLALLTMAYDQGCGILARTPPLEVPNFVGVKPFHFMLDFMDGKSIWTVLSQRTVPCAFDTPYRTIVILSAIFTGLAGVAVIYTGIRLWKILQLTRAECSQWEFSSAEDVSDVQAISPR